MNYYSVWHDYDGPPDLIEAERFGPGLNGEISFWIGFKCQGTYAKGYWGRVRVNHPDDIKGILFEKSVKQPMAKKGSTDGIN